MPPAARSPWVSSIIVSASSAAARASGQRPAGKLARFAIAPATDQSVRERLRELRRNEPARQRADGADRFLVAGELRLLDQLGGHAAKRLARYRGDEMREIGRKHERVVL